MHSTYLRRQHIHGVLLGAAVGNALGYARTGLSRRKALRLYGRSPVQYAILPGRGIYSSDTHVMFITAQAMLRSRSDGRSMRKHFRSRLRWYVLSGPAGLAGATLRAGLRSWGASFDMTSGVDSNENTPAASAVFSALAIHGTGHRIPKWVDDTVKLTRTNHYARAGGILLGNVAVIAATTKKDEFTPDTALQTIIDECEQDGMRKNLTKLQPFLKARRSPRAVARHFGWQKGVGSNLYDTAIMATYCWLRYPDDFRRAVDTAVTLGGDSASLGAVVGGLVGAHVGAEAVPEALAARLGGTPHGPVWIEKLGERFSHWPHGEHDLHIAPAEPSDPPMQIVRNLVTWPLLFCGYLRRKICCG